MKKTLILLLSCAFLAVPIESAECRGGGMGRGGSGGGSARRRRSRKKKNDKANAARLLRENVDGFRRDAAEDAA